MRTIIHDLSEENLNKFNFNSDDITESIKNSDEFVLISKCRYGCYSNNVKRVLERCIGYVLPYFTIRNGEIHHKSRYSKNLKLCVYLYGDIVESDKKVITNLVRANGVNLNTSYYEINYIDNIEEIDNAYTN